MKIVQVINTIITNSSKISDVIKNGDEYFFIYDKKYKWSINKSGKSEEDYFIHLYPSNDLSITELAYKMDYSNFNDYVTYSTEDLKTREATESFRELYQIVSNKVYGIDDIFNDIIGTE
jgi:hypothetical protein